MWRTCYNMSKENKLPKKILVTQHARKRMKERLKIKVCDAEHEAWQALVHGKKHKDTEGALHSYMTNAYKKTGRPNNMRVYRNSLFLFQDNVLLTVYEVPIYLRDKKISKNVKKVYSPREWQVFKEQLRTLKRVLRENKKDTELAQRYRADIKKLESKMYGGAK